MNKSSSLKSEIILIITTIFILSTICIAQDQSQDVPSLNIQWIEGPCTADIGDMAEIYVAEGYMFCNGNDARKIMEYMGNISSYKEEGLLADYNSDWFIVFEFNDIGYVKDDEKDRLDIDAMLDSIKKATEEANKYRKEKGFPSLFVDKWEIEPHYNEITNNLEWAIKGKDEYESTFINFNTRLLGRRGVMSVTLVTDPEQFSTVIPTYKRNLEGFEFKSGNTYAEFSKGDKIAKYGLSALVVGAGTAIAVKTGLIKYIWKFVVIIFAGIAALFRKITGFFKRIFRKNY